MKELEWQKMDLVEQCAWSWLVATVEGILDSEDVHDKQEGAEAFVAEHHDHYEPLVTKMVKALDYTLQESDTSYNWTFEKLTGRKPSGD